MNYSGILSREINKLVRNKAFMALVVLSVGMSIATPNFFTAEKYTWFIEPVCSVYNIGAWCNLDCYRSSL